VHKLNVVAEGCIGARRKPQERRLRKGEGAYNLARLKVQLVQSGAYDTFGGLTCHQLCLCAKFGVSPNYATAVHHYARECRSAPVLTMKKRELPEDAIGRVLLPKESLLTTRKYLARLSADDDVQLTRDPNTVHGLSGCESNRRKPQSLARTLFRKFVETNRSPTGRTPDKTGRCHGAEHYLFPQWTVLRKQRREQAGVDDSSIFTASFMKFAEATLVEMRLLGKATEKDTVPRDHQTIENWLREDFGCGSERGHTVLHPHSTDACATCVRFNGDIESLQASIKRHRQQNDQGSDERQAAIRELQIQLSDIQAEKKAHLDEAQAAKEHYAAVKKGAHGKYSALVDDWNRLREQYNQGAMTADDLAAFAKKAAGSEFVMEHDYQQDKHVPSWNQSPQPGPTNFMSHDTIYVHIILSQSLGLSDGPTRFGRNYMYTRHQCLGDGQNSLNKDSDDTASTILHFLSGNPETGHNPPQFRPGYDEDGPISN